MVAERKESKMIHYIADGRNLLSHLPFVYVGRSVYTSMSILFFMYLHSHLLPTYSTDFTHPPTSTMPPPSARGSIGQAVVASTPMSLV